MEELNKLRKLYRLKEVCRANQVRGRKESSAEHSWSCLLLADYFLETTSLKLGKLKVLELLVYHDLIEIEAGDVPLSQQAARQGKEKNEWEALKKLKPKLPKALQEKFENLFNEFEACETMEAKFARAIDQIDAVIHEMDYKEDWKGWTADFLREKKGRYFEPFPEIKEAFEKIISEMEKEGYFSQ